MTELFLTLIIVSAFVCTVCVVINIGSRKKAFPIISVCCCVMITALAFCCAVELKNNEKPQSTGQTVVTLSGRKNEKQTVKSSVKVNAETRKADKSQAEENSADRIVYITKTGEKYHYSYDCSAADFYECTLAEALEMGLEPCGKCVE